MKLGKLQKYWIEQLRKYPERQTYGILGEQSVDGEKYKACCLGELLLCSYRLKKKKLPFFNGRIRDIHINDSGVELDNEGFLESYNKFGLMSYDGGFLDVVTIEDDSYCSLTDMNDGGLSWLEIADYIENNPENVFTKSV